jgi:hypothetical protein
MTPGSASPFGLHSAVEECYRTRKNRYTDRAGQAVREELQPRLNAWMRSIQDPAFWRESNP